MRRDALTRPVLAVCALPALISLAVVVRYVPVLAKLDASVRVELVRRQAVRTIATLRDRIFGAQDPKPIERR